MSAEPKSGAAVLALPEAKPPFTQITCPGCRYTINIPIARKARLATYSPDSTIFVRDAEGGAWRPVQEEDGSWARQRTIY